MKKGYALLTAIGILFFGYTLTASAQSENGKEKALKEYVTTDINKVPVDVLKNISAKYNGFTVLEAFYSEEGIYKLLIAKENRTIKVYYKSTGEFIKEEI